MTPPDFLFTDQHEWIRPQGNQATVGISDFAQQALGDITFVEPPKVGRSLKKGDEAAAIESCKAAASVFSPAGGSVVEINPALADDPGLVNREPYTGGWIYRITLDNPQDLEKLMNAKQYDEFIPKED